MTYFSKHIDAKIDELAKKIGVSKETMRKSTAQMNIYEYEMVGLSLDIIAMEALDRVKHLRLTSAVGYTESETDQ